jgi:dephospho-CoA kinase
MLNVALTGNVASGKSSVARLFRDWGATVLDADAIVHELQRPGTPVFDAITRRFGADVVAADGSLDRARLGRRVFADSRERRALEAIVHPAVAAERERRMQQGRRRGDGIVVSDIPLLFEVMDPGAFDAVVLVDAPPTMRLDRLMARNGLDRESALAVITAQQPADGKRARSTHVIDNDGDLDLLERRAETVWQDLERLAGRRGGA